MSDLSREEELKQRISELAYACDKKKWLRVKRTFFVLSGVIYAAVLYIGLDYKIIDVKYLLSWLVATPVLAGFIFLISLGVSHYIITGAMEDEKAIAKLEGKLIEMQCYRNSKDE
jgi:hypothetical protein